MREKPEVNEKFKGLTIAIVALSVLIPLVVAILLFTPGLNVDPGFDIHILPKFHAILNSITAVLLLFGLYFIRKGKRTTHKAVMLFALLCSVIFLVSYVTYHSLADPTSYGGEGIWKALYYFILLTHILLAAIIVPFVLFTFMYALSNRFARHRRLARITWPLWFYVAVTGVLVYLMISPYYS